MVGYDVVFRGCGRRLEPCVYSALDGFLEGDFGAEEVDGPLGEDALVVFVDDLGGLGWCVSCGELGIELICGITYRLGHCWEERMEEIFTNRSTKVVFSISMPSLAGGARPDAR